MGAMYVPMLLHVPLAFPLDTPILTDLVKSTVPYNALHYITLMVVENVPGVIYHANHVKMVPVVIHVLKNTIKLFPIVYVYLVWLDVWPVKTECRVQHVKAINFSTKKPMIRWSVLPVVP